MKPRFSHRCPSLALGSFAFCSAWQESDEAPKQSKASAPKQSKQSGDNVMSDVATNLAQVSETHLKLEKFSDEGRG